MTTRKLFNPRNRIYFARILLSVAVIGWPITAMTLFKDEPQGILGLSWLAIILTSVDILFTTTVEDEAEKKEQREKRKEKKK